MEALCQLIPNLRLGFQPPMSSIRSARTAAAIPAFSRKTPASSPLPRFSYAANFLLNRKTFHAPNSGRLPAEKSFQGKATDSSGSNETEKTPQGPPFLTILAGAIVFFLFCCVVGSLVIWLVSPVVNLFISK